VTPITRVVSTAPALPGGATGVPKEIAEKIGVFAFLPRFRARMRAGLPVNQALELVWFLTPYPKPTT